MAFTRMCTEESVFIHPLNGLRNGIASEHRSADQVQAGIAWSGLLPLNRVIISFFQRRIHKSLYH